MLPNSSERSRSDQTARAPLPPDLLYTDPASSRAITASVTRAQRWPMNGNASLMVAAKVPCKDVRNRRRARCSRVFTVSGLIASWVAVYSTVHSSISRIT